MHALTLWQRLSLLFATLLLTCFGAAAWLQMDLSTRYSQQVEQHLLRRLADHIAAESRAMAPQGLDAARLAVVAKRLRITNPGVDLYVLDATGRVELRYPETGALQRATIDLTPVHAFLAGERSLLLGDDPRSSRGQKVFSAALDNRSPGPPGVLYAVLQGSAYDMAAAEAGRSGAVRIALWSIGLVAPLGLVGGVAAFALVARPLSRLTREVEALEQQGLQGRSLPTLGGGATAPGTRDEIAILGSAFHRLVATNARQWQALSQQDQSRRELIANLSHDLRTPLAAMHGYLETLLLRPPPAADGGQARILQAALAQSQQLSQLVQELLELARLELGAVKPVIERFSLAELVLDVMQKLTLSAAARGQRLEPRFAQDTPDISADIGMTERVLSNLLDNAIRHSAAGGHIAVELQTMPHSVRVTVVDDGPGIPPERRAALFQRPSDRPSGLPGGHGLGLAIVRQMLQLQGSAIELQERPGCGAVFVFELPRAADA